MKTTNLPQLSELLLVIKNMNDNIRLCESLLSDISKKLNDIDKEKTGATKHIVVIRKEDKKDKGDK